MVESNSSLQNPLYSESWHTDNSILENFLHFESWHIDKMALRNIKAGIILPRGARAKYSDFMNRNFQLGRNKSLICDRLGEVCMSYNEEKQTIDFTIDAYGGSGSHHKFVIGHEEGHVADLTGNLAVLWQTAKKLGFEFDFFSEEYAHTSDEFTKKLFYEGFSEEAMARSWKKPHNEREILAHIGGLVAIAQIDVSSSLINRVERAIRTNSEIQVRKTLEIAA